MPALQLFVISLVFSLLFAGQACARTIKIGVEDINYYPLYHFDSVSKRYSGYARDLLDGFGKEYGYEFEYHGMPIKRLYEHFFNGDVDVKFPDSPLWNHSARVGRAVRYSRPVIELKEVMFVRPENDQMQIQYFTQLGIIRGVTPWKLMPLIESGQVQVTEASRPEALLKMVYLGRVQGAIMDLAIGEHLMSIMPEKIRLLPNQSLLESQDGYFHLSSIHYPELVADFDRYLVSRAKHIKALGMKYGLKSPFKPVKKR